MPSRNMLSEPRMSCAVLAASCCVTSPGMATKFPKPASAAISRIPTPAVRLAVRVDQSLHPPLNGKVDDCGVRRAGQTGLRCA
jgi:hypothetical protein